jgi:hypothetical protein
MIRGTKGPSIRPRCIGAERSRTQIQSINQHDPAQQPLFNHNINVWKQIKISKFFICSFLHSLWLKRFLTIFFEIPWWVFSITLCTHTHTHTIEQISGICRITMKVLTFIRLPYTGWRGAKWHISNLNIAPARQLVVGRKGNGRGEDAISFGQSQWSVGTCNVLPVFVVITKQSLWRKRSLSLDDSSMLVERVAYRLGIPYWLGWRNLKKMVVCSTWSMELHEQCGRQRTCREWGKLLNAILNPRCASTLAFYEWVEKVYFECSKRSNFTLTNCKLCNNLTHWNTQPAVRRAEPSMPLLLILAFCR